MKTDFFSSFHIHLVRDFVSLIPFYNIEVYFWRFACSLALFKLCFH